MGHGTGIALSGGGVRASTNYAYWWLCSRKPAQSKTFELNWGPGHVPTTSPLMSPRSHSEGLVHSDADGVQNWLKCVARNLWKLNSHLVPNCNPRMWRMFVFVFVFHVFVRPCGHSSFRTNETRHMAEIHESKTHGRDTYTKQNTWQRQRATYNKAVTRQEKKTGTKICGKWALMPKLRF